MTWSHEVLAWAVQVQVASVVTVTVPLPAEAPTLAEVGFRE